jgi:hypothetical protein
MHLTVGALPFLASGFKVSSDDGPSVRQKNNDKKIMKRRKYGKPHDVVFGTSQPAIVPEREHMPGERNAANPTELGS